MVASLSHCLHANTGEAENEECVDFLSGLALITDSYSPGVLLSVSGENLVCLSLHCDNVQQLLYCTLPKSAHIQEFAN